MVLETNNHSSFSLQMQTNQYDEVMERISDCILLEEAKRRLASTNKSETLTQTEVMAELNISQADLDAVEVDIEK